MPGYLVTPKTARYNALLETPVRHYLDLRIQQKMDRFWEIVPD